LTFSGVYRTIFHRSHFPEKGLDGDSKQRTSTNATLAVIWEDSIQDVQTIGKDDFRRLTISRHYAL
jgi:hypothetical protein